MDTNLIFEIDKILDPELCNQIIHRFEQDPNKKQSVIINPIDKSEFHNLKLRNSKEIHIFSNENNDWTHISLQLEDILKECVKMYDTEFRKIVMDIGEDPEFLSRQIWKNTNLQVGYSGFSIQRVEPDTWYRWHHDCNYGKRIMQCIFYLNTMNEGEGGTTRFISGREVKPEVGKVLMFPTSWSNFHSGSHIFKKPKYICTTSLYLQN
jgi:hypothetical protein|tara:strand:- start:38 stop:661 length:624 start_codon:yes stop_codon:yes gene_type:complete